MNDAVLRQEITASNAPASFGVQGLPGWLSVNANTGLVSGTHNVPGTVTLNAYNSTGKGTATLTLTVTQ